MGQTYTGQVVNGVVVFEAGRESPEGTKVRLEPIPAEDDKIPSLADRLRSVIGTAKEIPSDFAEQHDHYIHGTPKR